MKATARDANLILGKKSLLYMDCERSQLWLPKLTSAICRQIFLAKVKSGRVYTLKLESLCFLKMLRKANL